MSLEATLIEMLQELNDYENKNYNIAISERLNRGLLAYNKEIEESYTYLSYRDSMRVLKRMNQLCKT